MLHVALLAILTAERSTRTSLPEAPLLLVTISGREGGEPIPLARAAAPSPTGPPAKTAPPRSTPPRPPPPLESARPATAPPSPPAEEPWIDTESLEAAALEPEFDREPDPSATGDAAVATAVGAFPDEAGVQCPLVGVVRDTLQQDEVVQFFLARIPPRSRSVANVVMLWDGRWIDADRVGGPSAVASVRTAIAAGLEGASDACRAQVILGPVFLPIEGRSGTLVLALGSGAWRWADLLSETPLEGPDRTDSGETQPRPLR